METTLLYFTGAFSLLCLAGVIYMMIISPANRRLLEPKTGGLPITDRDPEKRYKLKIGGIPLEIADKQCQAYEDSVTFYKKAIVCHYNLLEFSTYVDVFKKHTSALKPPGNYEWKIASSPMFMMDENGEARLVVCILPTLASKANKNDIYHFFEEKRKKSAIYIDYFHKLNNLIKEEISNTPDEPDRKFGSSVYDEGHLYP